MLLNMFIVSPFPSKVHILSFIGSSVANDGSLKRRSSQNLASRDARKSLTQGKKNLFISNLLCNNLSNLFCISRISLVAHLYCHFYNYKGYSLMKSLF